MTRKKLCTVLLLLLAMLLLVSCGKKPETNGSKNGEKKQTVYEAGQSAEALLDYAKRMEASGNDEAAEAAYALIDKTVAADGIYKGKKSAYEESPLAEAEELRSIVDELEGK